MPPKKRKQDSGSDKNTNPSKRISKVEREKLICKKKLDKLDREESLKREDRFSSEEKKLLLDAYNEHGFKVFQDTKLLHQYLPNRREVDLNGLVQRLKTSLQANFDTTRSEQPLDKWQKLCQQLMSNYARNHKVNLDDVVSEALMAEAREVSETNNEETSHMSPRGSNDESCHKPDYSKLLESFAHLLMGKFPENMSAANAQLSMKLFEHINNVVSSFDFQTTFSSLQEGAWLESVAEEGRMRQESALRGLQEIDGITKKRPSLRDIDRSVDMKALCLELPKIKRITDVLNPLHLNELLVKSLME